MAITLTDAAADRVKSFLQQRGTGLGLRLGVRTSGCSGMAYVLEFVDELDEDDVVFEDRNVGLSQCLLDKGRFYGPSGRISGVDHASMAVPPFASEMELRGSIKAGMSRKCDALLNQPLNTGP